MKIGILGGTFNPIHYGHLRAAEEVREKLNLDKILFIPSGNPPLKIKDIAPAKHRYEMTRLAVRKSRLFKVLDIESARREKSFTVKTLRKLQMLYRNSDFYFILGIDAFLDIPNWWRPEDLLTLTNFVIISRPDNMFTDLRYSPYLDIKKTVLNRLDRGKMELLSYKLISLKEVVLLRITSISISSTEIRKRLKEGLSIKYLLPERVESYIISNKIYSG